MTYRNKHAYGNGVKAASFIMGFATTTHTERKALKEKKQAQQQKKIDHMIGAETIEAKMFDEDEF
ncbi:MAG: hypothetical protein AB9836_05900 [Aminipila sp.]